MAGTHPKMAQTTALSKWVMVSASATASVATWMPIWCSCSMKYWRSRKARTRLYNDDTVQGWLRAADAA